MAAVAAGSCCTFVWVDVVVVAAAADLYQLYNDLDQRHHYYFWYSNATPTNRFDTVAVVEGLYLTPRVDEFWRNFYQSYLKNGYYYYWCWWWWNLRRRLFYHQYH